MIETHAIASTIGAGFLNWALYDVVDGKSKKWAMLKLTISVAAIAARVGMGPPECTLRDLQILSAMTGFCSMISAIRGRHPGQAVMKLGVAAGAMVGLQLTHFPKEVVLRNVLSLTKVGSFVGAAVCSIWSATELFKGYRSNNVQLLKGGLQSAAHIVPLIGIGALSNQLIDQF